MHILCIMYTEGRDYSKTAIMIGVWSILRNLRKFACLMSFSSCRKWQTLPPQNIIFVFSCLSWRCCWQKWYIGTLNLSLDSSPAYHLKLSRKKTKLVWKLSVREKWKNGKQAKNIMAAKYKLFLRFVWIKLKRRREMCLFPFCHF